MFNIRKKHVEQLIIILIFVFTFFTFMTDSSKAELIIETKNQLKIQSASYEWDFSDETEYNYDSDLIEVANGEATLLISKAYLYYKMNDIYDSNVIYDESGNGRNGTAYNMGSWSIRDGKIDNGIIFNSDNLTEIRLPNYSALFEWNETFSIEVWYNIASGLLNARAYFSNLDNGGGDGFRGIEARFSNGRLYLSLNNVWGTNYIEVYCPSAFTGLKHAVWVYDGSGLASGIKLYVNGLIRNLAINSDNLNENSIVPINQGKTRIRIGDGVLAPTNLDAHYLDEYIIYDYNVSQEHIDYRYNNGDGIDELPFTCQRPTIAPTINYTYTYPIESLEHTASIPEGSHLMYQLSNDNGDTWQWYNGSQWKTTTNKTESNNMTYINSNLDSFATSGVFTFKALLCTNGSLNSIPSLDNFIITDSTPEETTTTIIAGGGGGGGGGGLIPIIQLPQLFFDPLWLLVPIIAFAGIKGIQMKRKKPKAIKDTMYLKERSQMLR